MNVFLGHDKSFKELRSEVGWWFAQQGGGWYLKALKCAKSAVIGWMLNSTIDMDRDVLKLRLCPQLQDATDPSLITKLERLRIRQAAFLANVQTTISGDIGVLDFVDPKMYTAV